MPKLAEDAHRRAQPLTNEDRLVISALSSNAPVFVREKMKRKVTRVTKRWRQKGDTAATIAKMHSGSSIALAAILARRWSDW
jgi:hypothetical protein